MRTKTAVMNLHTPLYKNRKKGLAQQIFKYRSLMLMLLPTVLLFLVFRYGPILGLVVAFKEFRPQAGASFIQAILDSPWVGLKHFEDFFGSTSGLQVFFNTLIISTLKIVFGFPAPIILAVMLNEVRSRIFKRTVQTISYLPHFISWVILAGIIRFVFSPDYGLVVPVFNALNVDPINFLGDSSFFRALLVTTDIWAGVGWGSVVYLAALAGVNPELYESAIIDGAGRFKQLIYITLPSISSTIVVMLILRTGRILNAGFDQVFNLYNPGVYSVGDILDTYVLRQGLQLFQFSYSTAVGFFQSLAGFLLVLLTNFIAKRFNEEGIW